MNRNFYLTPCFPAFFIFITTIVMVFFFQKSVYTYFMNEPDFIYGDIRTLLFISFCLFVFCLGFKVGNFKPIIKFDIYFFLIDPLVFFKIVLYIGYILIVIYLLFFNYFVFIKFHLTFLDILFIYGYQYLKYRPSFIPFGIGAIPTFLGFYSFFILYMFYFFKYNLNIKYNAFKVHLFIILVFVINIFTVNRNIIVIMFFGLILIYHYYYKKFNIIKFIKIILILIIIFMLTLILRFGSINNSRLIGENIIGYTVASYNRLALIISHNAELKDVNPSIIDLFLPNRIPLFNIYIKQPLSMSEYLDHWHFLLKNYNLNYWFNLKTLFGDVYNRIGIFSFLYFFIWGILGARLYQSFKKGRIIGILFYPSFFASIFVWPLTNIFVSNLFQNIYAFFFIFILHLIIAPNLKKYKGNKPSKESSIRN